MAISISPAGIIVRDREFSTGAAVAAADWPVTNTDAGVTTSISTRRWQVTTGTTLNSGAGLLTSAGPMGPANIGHLALAEVSSTTSCHFQVSIRGSGSQHFQWPGSGYGIQWDPSTSGFTLYETNGFTSLATGSSIGTIGAGTLVWLQIEAIGQIVRARIWKHSAAIYPPPWTSVYDTTNYNPGAGYGMIGFENNAAAARTGFFHRSTLYIPQTTDPRRLIVALDPGVSTVTGSAASTLGAFTPSATGATGPSGTSSTTLGPFTPSAAGSSTTGSSARTLGAFTPNATGATGASGTSATTLGAFVTSASGTATPPTASGTAAVTLGAFTSSASGSTVSGTSARTLGPFVSTATGGTGPSGTVARTLQPFVPAASGSSTTGTSNRTLAPFTAAGTGGTGPSGTAAVTLGVFTPVAVGGAGAAGTLAVQLAAFIGQASGSSVVGTAAVVLAALTAVATGSHVVAERPGCIHATLQPTGRVEAELVTAGVTAVIAPTGRITIILEEC